MNQAAFGLVTLLRALVVASLAVAAAGAAWHVAGLDAVIAPPPPPPAEAPAPAAPPQTAPILSAGLFGRPPPPETQLARSAPSDLALRGIFLDAGGAGSRAFISSSGQTAAYGLGELVPGGGTLSEIEEDLVVLEADGARIVLTFAGAEADGPRELTAAERLAAAISTPEMATSIDLSPDGSEPETFQDHLDLWRDRIMRNPGQVLDQIGLIPTEEGYKIAPEHDSGVRLAGLRTGDVVTSVNGRPVGDVEADRRKLDSIEADGQARLEIQREGRTIVLTFPLR